MIKTHYPFNNSTITILVVVLSIVEAIWEQIILKTWVLLRTMGRTFSLGINWWLLLKASNRQL